MKRSVKPSGPLWLRQNAIFFATICVLALLEQTRAVILTPPYFNLAEGRRITASATCGVDTEGPELYCKLVGANTEREEPVNLIQGQFCDHCDPTRPDKMHPPEFAVDGMETWWQSPPLSRGMKYNEVNLTIDLGQEFHVAYIYLRMGNSPRPGLWVLEKSSDYGKTYTPWQYFSDSTADCETYFGKESLEHITRDDSVICSTEYSKIVPLEGGEIPISLLNNRPSANWYFNSSVLQEWTRATNVRLRLLRTKNLLGHLMSVARQDPTVTRRYFYSIKDISIGGRCMCNGHADTCDIQDPQDPKKLLCRCQHHTCGPQCAQCCPGFEQKAWRISKAYKKFECEPCNCFNHSNECHYDADIDAQHLSQDVHGNYEGGGVCENCQHNTEGINCNRCKSTYYRPYNKEWYDIDVCSPCRCDYFYSTGNCAEGTGQCECRPEFTPPNCDSCSYGYFGYPKCRPCECNLNGTMGGHCEATEGYCPCKENYSGNYCNQCADTYYKFPKCLECQCNSIGSLSDSCNQETGNCSCKSNYRGRTCDQCEHGYFSYPTCTYCSCDTSGTLPGICNKTSGSCMCKEGYGGPRCDQCIPGYYGYPDCRPCNCSEVGSVGQFCDISGKCSCLSNFAGRTCDQCSAGNFKFPECLPCNCDANGAIGVSCDHDGKCQCKSNFDNNQCNQCKEGYYNFPICEGCNCNPAGLSAAFAGCGSVPAGELCDCKSRVHGRICDTCRPLFWNLQQTNPEGCEHCNCHIPGVVGGIGICEPSTGQCICKPSVGGQRCQECADGSYDLEEDDLFGCKDCDCDIGGSINGICDKRDGQCQCQARINGRTCREPLQAHYFPTMYQFKYEVEDGRTPVNTPVRYGFDEHEFSHFSWKGYAVFSTLQNQIIRDVYIEKPSLYRMVLNYVNPNQENVHGIVMINPDNPTDIEQKFDVQFKSTKSPTLVTVGGPPLVMNPGRWAVSIKSNKKLLLDYFVLLPEAYYEATILAQRVDTACKIGQTGLCRHYSYPNVSQFDAAHGDGGFITLGAFKESLTDFFTEQDQLDELGVGPLAILGGEQRAFNMNLTVTKPGNYVLLVTYATPLTGVQEHEDYGKMHHVKVTHEENTRNRNDFVVQLSPCQYTMLCRQVITDEERRIAHFHFDNNFNTIRLEGDEDVYAGIKSIVAIPHGKWSLDYIRPQSVCVRKDGKCVPSKYPIAPDSKKVKFEVGNEGQIAKNRPPNIYDNSSNLIYLDHKDAMVDIKSKVPYPGYYVFIVQFYQPDHPEFDMNVLIQNGQFYEAKLPVRHCPSNSGCRSIISQEDGNIRFSLTENFVLTLKEPNHKSVWLEYLLVVPAELYTEHILSEEDFDQTGEFISTCGNDHFHINTTVEGFCKEAVFSLTADYNNGALPCDCDYAGSLSFECEKFGGQCQCKPNVIGRKCELCKTGYYGFPDCRPCNCPSTALCEPQSGQCICPPRVMGERCDQCTPYTFGFDQIIGCEDCNCNPLGVLRDLQCDLFNGSCTCKPNIVERACDQCQAGFYAFPYCERCHCELKGTTIDICNQDSGHCSCKQHVQGPECNYCAEGTFNLQQSNQEGCTKCFCFGKTTRCTSSRLFRTQIGGMQNWTLYSIIEDITMEVVPLDSNIEQLNSSVIGADLTLYDSESDEEIIYFSAPDHYLGNKLTSYGGYLNYTIFYTISNRGGAVQGADLILFGANTYLLHRPIEQPPPTQDYYASVELVETNFELPNELAANRDHIMTVLEDLQGIYIRASYWASGITTRLSEVSLDTATSKYFPNSHEAVSVEQCQCPPNYKGLSCEECAPGYWRATPDYCAPCQCNGHADECDVVSGVCIDCRHSTRGDHCELCDIGYHGNALQGTPMDCLICACPLPVSSNNFATGCEVSTDGTEISCDCIPGYYGPRCESCAAGFFGTPETLGETCDLCNCSGNINPNEPGNCDSVTGECLKCMNNTYGEACALCAPGFFGDAIISKNCQTCDCAPHGTSHCDSYTGICECLPNIVGEKCDLCEKNHYGLLSEQGCTPCNCQEASESSQCDDATGQCRCRSGVTGRNCDRCAPGFWDYTPEGCVSCGCNTEYSLGFGCDANTGQCVCLPGVIGEKCDHCPYRWVLILNQGCFECNKCTHNLLDTTDDLRNLIDPVITEFEAVASGYFAAKRLQYINETYHDTKPMVDRLSESQQIDIFAPVTQRLDLVESESKNLNRRANFSEDRGNNIAPEATQLRKDALDVLNVIRLAAIKANNTVNEINALTFDNNEGPKIDQALVEAEHIVKEIRKYNLSGHEMDALTQLEKAKEVLEIVEQFHIPIYDQTGNWEQMKKDIKHFNDKLDDLRNYTQYSDEKIAEVDSITDKYRGDIVYEKKNTIENTLEESEVDLSISEDYIKNATKLLKKVNKTSGALNEGVEEFNQLMNEFNSSLISQEVQDELNKLVEQSFDHAKNLSDQSEMLDHIFSQTRHISGDALGAANAYKNIVNATNSAKIAADDALDAAEKAINLLDGLEDKSKDSETISSELLDEANTALYNAQVELKPQLEEAGVEIDTIEKTSNQSENEYKKILDALKRLETQNFAELSEEAITMAQVADNQAQDALDSVSLIAEHVDNDLKNATTLQKDTENIKRNIQQAETQLNMVNKILPNITNLIDELGPQQQQLQNTVGDIEDKIKKLNHQIAMARELANRVKVGVQFFPNTTLELKNPPNLPDQATSSHASFYFKTDKPNGFLIYLGNPEGTKLRRTKTDDYMAVEIENGYPVLTWDIGDGPERIISDQYVSDNQWYQAVIDRTGPYTTFTIREQIDDKIIDHTKEHVFPGTSTIFNLDPEQSRLFVGGYPSSFEPQGRIHHSSFDGQIEELIIGDRHVGLWNFKDGDENHVGAPLRNKFIHAEASTGYRFNGNGYAILDSRTHSLRQRTEIRFYFKTSAYEGLMFLVGNQEFGTFMSIELRAGGVLFQYDLGDGLVSINSKKQCSDGAWHLVKASRDGLRGVLEVDNEEKITASSSGPSKVVEVNDLMFFGGYPHQHTYRYVTNVDFDGCLDEVNIINTPVDLSRNLKAYGVLPGCPVKFASLVSFSKEKSGFIRHPNVTSSNYFKVSLKFKTEEPNGLIFYATDRDQTAGVSLALINSVLILISQKIELPTSTNDKYNDNQWHVVTVTHNEQELRMSIDDWESVATDSPEKPLHIMYGDMFIGGLPPNYSAIKGSVKTSTPFVGCIGDATLNGMVINFANSTDKQGDILGRCILDKTDEGDYSDLHKLPVVDKGPSRSWTEAPTTTEEPFPTGKPIRGDGGDDDGGKSGEDATEFIPATTTVKSLFEHEREHTTMPEFKPEFKPEFRPELIPTTTEEDEIEATEEPIRTLPPITEPSEPEETDKVTRLPPIYEDQCALPMVPAEQDYKDGYRFGTAEDSRVEYDQSRGRYKNSHDFSIDFRTISPDGLIFYVSDVKHLHFVSLYINGGKLNYKFRCGTQPVVLESDHTYNDGLWHTVIFSRNQTDGKLTVDDRLVAEGHSNIPSNKHLNITPPYYIGAVPKKIQDDVKPVLNFYNPFNGCLRNFHMNGRPMQNPRVVNTLPCSDNTESGTFFGAKGGHVKLKESFHVGVEIDIQMDIKPRNVSGLLMSVHGKKDYLVLQIVDGVIIFKVNNGRGPMITSFKPPDNKYYFCDGNWHSIQAIKSKNVVSLSVDKTFAGAGVGELNKPTTDTRYGLFLGGHQLFKQNKKIRGVEVHNSFVGCIRNLHINNKLVNIEPAMVQGDVSVGVCQTN